MPRGAADLFLRHFGPEHGVELPLRQQYRYRPVEFPPDESAHGRTGTLTVALSWLLDTNVVSEMMRSQPDRRVINHLSAIPQQRVGLSSVTVWEILNGIGQLEPGRQAHEPGGALPVCAPRIGGSRAGLGRSPTLGCAPTSWRLAAASDDLSTPSFRMLSLRQRQSAAA